MSRRNTRQGKARRRAERDRPRVPERELKHPGTSDQRPRADGLEAFLAAPRPAGPGPRNSDEHGSGLRSDADGGSIAVELDEADLDTGADLGNADPGDFGDLDGDDAGLQAALTVLAVLADDISDVAGVADDLAGDAGGADVAEDLEGTETGQLSAEANAEADKGRRETVELRNHADALIHQVEKSLKEYGDKASAQDKGEAEAAIAAARSALDANDAAQLKQATERLSQAAMKIGEAMYKAQAAEQAANATGQANAGSGASGASPDEKVVDAEFEEVDEQKKRSA